MLSSLCILNEMLKPSRGITHSCVAVIPEFDFHVPHRGPLACKTADVQIFQFHLHRCIERRSKGILSCRSRLLTGAQHVVARCRHQHGAAAKHNSTMHSVLQQTKTEEATSGECCPCNATGSSDAETIDVGSVAVCSNSDSSENTLPRERPHRSAII